MDSSAQLHNSPSPRSAGWPSQPIDPYQMGRVVEQLTQNTTAVQKLAEAVQQQTETLYTMSRDLSELRDGLKHANNDIRKLAESTITRDALDARLRELGLDPVDSASHRKNQAFLTRRRIDLEERSSTKRHVRNVLAAAIAVALMWWAWDAMLHKMQDTIKQASATEVRKP